MALSGIHLFLHNKLARIIGCANKNSGKIELNKIKKIVLIQPPEASPFDDYVLPTRYPLNLFTLTGALMQKFSNLEIIVVDLGLPNMDLTKILKEENPDMVGITFMTPQYKMTIDIVDKVRKTLGEKVQIVGGGVHSTALPHETMREIDFNFLVVHEGEETFPDLILALDKEITLNKVRSIFYREKGEVIGTDSRPRIQNLDSFPLATEVLPLGYLDQYAVTQEIEKSGIMAPIFSSRGCPKACAFCASNVVFLQKAGVKNPVLRGHDLILREIMQLYHEHGISIVRFADDFFDINQERALAIANGILDSSIRESMEFSFMALARKGMSIEYYKLLRKAGFRRVAFGIESGDPELMEKMGKMNGINFGEENTFAAQRGGIKVKWYLMVGLPDQDWKSINKTIAFVNQNRPDYIGVAIATPYPGTRLAEMGNITIKSGYGGMIHEPPPNLKGREFTPFTYTNVMKAEEIGAARQLTLNSFDLLQQI